MERKIDQIKGVRSQDETAKLKQDEEELKNALEDKRKDYLQLSTSNKKLKDDCRNIDRDIIKARERKENLHNIIEELKLENEMARGDLENVIKQKEKTLVQHDVMKLEIKELRERVHGGADIVFGLENRKYQLEMSMEEREKEIKVHKDILVSELKSAEAERHQVKVELQERRNMVKNLRIKYEGLCMRNKSSSGEAPGDHSQAYYVIQAA